MMKRIWFRVPRWRWVTVSLAVALAVAMTGMSAGVATASAATPGLPRSVRPVPRSEFRLSQAPSGLRAAVARTLGARHANVTWSEQTKLVPSNAAEDDTFGASVSISSHTAVVGAPSKNEDTGAAYVFVRTGRTWSEQTELTLPHGKPGDFFGASVAISGTTVVVGSPEPAPDPTFPAGLSGHARGSGAAYVFVRTGMRWSEQAKLTASDAAEGDSFGESVAISPTTVVVGAPGKDLLRGAAYVFVRTGMRWSEQAKLTLSNAAEDDVFGASVAISGATVVVGAPNRNSYKGAAYVFVRTGMRWSEQAELTHSSSYRLPRFGWSVAISGTTVVVGAPFENILSGAVYVFVRTGMHWSEQARLTPSDAREFSDFGYSVSISGNAALIGEPLRGTGGAYVFVRTGRMWSEQAKLTASDAGPADAFGTSVSISGATALIGAPFNTPSNERSGAAYVFVP